MYGKIGWPMIVTATLVIATGEAAVAEEANLEVSSRSAVAPVPHAGGGPFAACSSQPFTDVLTSDSFCPYIRELAADGITSGCGASTYCPDSPVTRGQMAVFMERIMRGTTAWDAWRDGPMTPSGWNVGAETVTANVGSLYEHTVGAAAGDESGIYFDADSVILWSDGGGGNDGFLKVYDRDTDSEEFRVGDSGEGANLFLNPSGPDDNSSIYFYDAGSATFRSLSWSDTNNRFELNAGLDLGSASPSLTAYNDLDLRGPAYVQLGCDSDSNSTSDYIGFYHNNGTLNPSKMAELQEDGDFLIRGTFSDMQSFDVAESFLKSEAVAPGDVVRVDPRRANAVRLGSAADGGAVLGVVSTKPGLVLGGAVLDVPGLAAWGADIGAEFESQKGRLRDAVFGFHPELAHNERRLATEAEKARALPSAAARREREGELRAERERAEARVESLMLEAFFAKRAAPVALAGRVPVNVDASRGAIRPGDLLTASPIPGVAMRARTAGPVLGTALEGLTGGRGQIEMFVRGGWFAGDRAPEAQRQITLGQERDGQKFVIDRETEEGTMELVRVDLGGNLGVRGTVAAAPTGYAESFLVSEAVETGDVVVADGLAAGFVHPTDQAADAAVVGIVTGQPGFLGGPLTSSGEPPAAARAAVAVAGSVLAKVDAGYGEVRVGSLLTTSPTRGHAMAAPRARPGTIVAKALESLASGRGLIRVLVMPR